GKDVRSEHVPSDDGEIGRCFGSRWLFHEIAHLIDAGPQLGVWLDGDHTVAGDVLARDPFHGKNRPVETIESIDQLADGRRLGVDDIVAEDDRKRFVSHQLACDQYRMAQTERLALTHIREVYEVGDLPDLGELIALAASLEEGLEFDRDVKVILDRVLSPAG